MAAVLALAACGGGRGPSEASPEPKPRVPGGVSEGPAPSASATARPTPAQTALPTIPCDSVEHLTFHVHARLTIFNAGRQITAPANVGIRSSCLYWLHTHDTTGVIHVEAPGRRDFVLRQFFTVWGQPLDSTGLMNFRADATHSIKAWVDGAPWNNDPGLIPLREGADIVLAYGPPFPLGLP